MEQSFSVSLHHPEAATVRELPTCVVLAVGHLSIFFPNLGELEQWIAAAWLQATLAEVKA